MPRHCATIRLGDGFTAMVCGSGMKPCRFCGALAGYLCDAPRDRGRPRPTCDAPLCERCRVPQGPTRDYCPDHATQAVHQGQLFPAVLVAPDGGQDA